MIPALAPFFASRVSSVVLAAAGAAAFGGLVYWYVEGERDQREARVRGEIAEQTHDKEQEIEAQTDEIFRSTGTDDVVDSLRHGQFAVGGLPEFGSKAPRVERVRPNLSSGRPDGDGSGDAYDALADSVHHPRGDGVRGIEAGEQRSQGDTQLTCTDARAATTAALQAEIKACARDRHGRTTADRSDAAPGE